MALADGQPAPLPPLVYAVYRGFYVLPGDTPTKSIVRVDFFCSRSTDDLVYQNWTYIGSGDNTVGFYFVHGGGSFSGHGGEGSLNAGITGNTGGSNDQIWAIMGLDEHTYYAYYAQYVYSDGSKSPIGQIAYPGRAQLIITPVLNIDQLASKAYSTGLVTSGIFQGIIFRTNATNPKVQMDTNGIHGWDANGNIVFDLPEDGSTATFTGIVNATGLTLLASGGIKGVNSEIKWDRASDDALVADVYGQSSIAGEADLILEAQPIDAATKLVQLVMAAKGSSSGITFGFAPGSVGGTLMDASGASSFIQILAGTLRMNLGPQQAVLYNYGAGLGQTVTIGSIASLLPDAGGGWTALGYCYGSPTSWSIAVSGSNLTANFSGASGGAAGTLFVHFLQWA